MGHSSTFISIILELSLRFIACLKQKKLEIGQFLSSLVFCNYIILVGHIVNISKTTIPKLKLHLQLSDELPRVLFKEFYIHSMKIIYQCILNNFNALLSKIIGNFF